MALIKLIPCLLLALMANMFATAQVIEDESRWLNPQNSSVAYSYLSVNEGLSSNNVRALLQDRYGYIWVGTGRGLNRWDGYNAVQYQSTIGLAITSLCETNDTLWIGTESGLYLYLQRSDSICSFETKTSDVELRQINVSHILADKTGNIWIASMSHGILRIGKDKTLKKMPVPDETSSYACLHIDSSNRVWATSNWAKHTLVVFDQKNERFKYAELVFDSPATPSYPALSLTQSADGYMWMATAIGDIIRFNPATMAATVEKKHEESGIKNAHSIIEVKNGHFLIGSDAGLTLYSATTHTVRQHTTTTEARGGLNDNFVYPIIQDREGGTWIGTFYGGVNYYHPTLGNFTSHVQTQHHNSVRGNVINHFCEDKHGRIWIASDDGGLTVFSPKTGEYKAVKLTSQQENNVHALAVKDNELYVGTYAQGIAVVDINTLKVTHISALEDEQGQNIDISSFEIMVDSKGNVWIGTFNAICLFNTQTRKCRVMQRVLAPVIDMLESKEGTLWFATETTGLWAYSSKNGKWRQYGNKALCGKNDGAVAANSLYEDEAGRIICGTSVGLLKYDKANDTFSEMGLPENVHNVMAVTGIGDTLWLATNSGVCRYAVKEEKVEQVFKGDSFVTTDFLPGAIFKSSSGDVYIGTSHGYVSFTPQGMRHNDVVPQVRFTAIEVFNKRVPVGGKILKESLNHTNEIELSYSDNVVRLVFSAMSFVQPTDNTYSYYLEGFDKEWINGSNHHSVTYTNLSPGTYIFHVRASNNDGVFSTETTLKIVITPPFYWNTPARIVYLLLILLAAYYAVRRQMRRAEKRHKAEIEEIHTQKEQEIQEINTQKEQEIQEINIQKEQEIQEINTQKEQEVHEARIKFMTITPRDQEFLDRLENAVEQNFTNPDLNVEDLAQAVGISRTGLFTKLKSLADVTPNEMIQVIRLRHAAELLLENRYRVSEVCYMCGFSSPSYFSKCFQKQYGVTPAKYEG